MGRAKYAGLAQIQVQPSAQLFVIQKEKKKNQIISTVQEPNQLS